MWETEEARETQTFMWHKATEGEEGESAECTRREGRKEVGVKTNTVEGTKDNSSMRSIGRDLGGTQGM